MPLISVIVPTHNRPDFLAEALASVRAQTFTDYEIIVVSNGESAEMRRRTEAAAVPLGASWFALDEGNLPAARNFGVAQCGGDWIAFLDDDDLWMPEKLERQLAEAERSGADMISGDYVEIWPDGERLRQPRLPQGWSYTKAASHMGHWCNPPSCVLLRKDVFDRVGGFDPQQRCAEDNDLWRRVSWCHRIHHVEEPLLRYRCGHTSLMRNARRMLIYEMRHYIKMRLDTPSNLRSALPALRYIAAKLWRFLRWYTPVWLRQPRKQWIALRQRLNFTSW